jgi:PAS domain-containing protein
MSGEMEREYYERGCYKIRNKKLIYWNNALIKDEVGQIKELLCSGIDITERKHSEEALIKSRMSFIC